MQTGLTQYQDSTFIRHEACPDCGSRDALGVYDDAHTYCFSCHTHTQNAEPSEAADATTAEPLQNQKVESVKTYSRARFKRYQPED